MNTHAVMDHKAAFGRLDEGLRLALEQAEGDPATLAWLIGATLLSLGQQGYLDKRVNLTRPEEGFPMLKKGTIEKTDKIVR